MIPATEFASTPVGQLRPAESVILDWHDGPREGFLRFEVPPSTWYFRLLAQTTDPDDVDNRVFWFAPAPDDTLPRLHSALLPLGPPPRPFWTPVWRFPDDASRDLADATVAELVGRVAPPEVLVESRDLTTFRRVWLSVPDAQ
jgi:hypothetical protein